MVLVTWPVSACPPGSGDLRRAVAERPEDLVALRGWRAAEKGLTKEWIYVFPDDLSFFGDFEETSEGRLGDQRIPVWQPLRAAHARREEIPSWLVLILPHDLVCGRIDFDCPRIRYSIVETMRSVVEYQDVAVLQEGWRMLARDRRCAKLPSDFAGLARDANDRGGRPVAGEDIAVG